MRHWEGNKQDSYAEAIWLLNTNPRSTAIIWHSLFLICCNLSTFWSYRFVFYCFFFFHSGTWRVLNTFFFLLLCLRRSDCSFSIKFHFYFIYLKIVYFLIFFFFFSFFGYFRWCFSFPGWFSHCGYFFLNTDSPGHRTSFFHHNFLKYCWPARCNVKYVLLLASSVWWIWMSAAAGAERRFWQQWSTAINADPQQP